MTPTSYFVSLDYQVSVDPVDLDKASGLFYSFLLVLIGRFVVDAQWVSAAANACNATRVADVGDINL